MLSELLATPDVAEDAVFRARTGVLALHGGLEAGTDWAAKRCAAMAGASLYAVVQPDDMRWHFPSTSFDPGQSPKLSAFLDHVLAAVSFHGFGRKGLERSVLIGGTNAPMRAAIAAALGEATDLTVIAQEDLIPAGLRGIHPRNPVNMSTYGGVQIEMSPQAREPDPLLQLVTAVAGVLDSDEWTVPAP